MFFRTGTAVRLSILFLFSGLLHGDVRDANQVYDPALFQALEYRLLGPYRGGRVTAVTGVVGDPFTYFMGSTGGGVFRSSDGGTTWDKVLYVHDGLGAADLAMDANNPRVLYAALWRAERKPWTIVSGDEEGGVFKTTDGGDRWEKLSGGLPTGLVGRIGIAVSPANSQRVWALVEAIDEGGIYSSDDAGASWHLINRDRLLQQRAWYYMHIFADPVDENTLYALNTHSPENPPNGAVIFYDFEDEPEGDVRLEILDRNGDVVRRYSSRPSGRKPPKPAFGTPIDPVVSKKKGMNRFVWNLTYPGPNLTDDALMYIGYSGGPVAVPGTYQVRLSHGDFSATTQFELLKDPRVATTIADYQEQFDLLVQIRDKLTEIHDAIRSIRDVRQQVEELSNRLVEVGQSDDVEPAAKGLKDKLTALENELIQTKNEAHQDPINFPPQLDTRFGFVYGYVHRLNGKPTEGAYKRFNDLKPRLAEKLTRYQDAKDNELAAFNTLVREKGVLPVIVGR